MLLNDNKLVASDIVKSIHHTVKLNADQPHPRNYPQMPRDYRHTDNDLRLVMVDDTLYLTRQSGAPNIYRCVPYI